MGADLTNLIRREVQRADSRRSREMVGFISGYNPVDHTAKVTYPTELDPFGNPKISGWIPHQVQAGGAGASWVIAPTVGDQCTTSPLEGDPDSHVITGYLHSTALTPPSANPSQAILRHTVSGNYFTMNTDGSFQCFHAATGNYSKLCANGNIVGYIADPSKTQHYVGGDPAVAGTFSPITTTAGPSPYSQARVS